MARPAGTRSTPRTKVDAWCRSQHLYRPSPLPSVMVRTFVSSEMRVKMGPSNQPGKHRLEPEPGQALNRRLVAGALIAAPIIPIISTTVTAGNASATEARPAHPDGASWSSNTHGYHDPADEADDLDPGDAFVIPGAEVVSLARAGMGWLFEPTAYLPAVPPGEVGAGGRHRLITNDIRADELTVRIPRFVDPPPPPRPPTMTGPGGDDHEDDGEFVEDIPPKPGLDDVPDIYSGQLHRLLDTAPSALAD